MTLSHHYHAAQTLSPKAARMAARLLDGSMNIPYEWRLSLRIALVERGRFAGPLTITDLSPLSAEDSDPSRIQSPDAQAQDAASRPQVQARRFIEAVQGDPEAGEAE
jgi:hypothetical protein